MQPVITQKHMYNALFEAPGFINLPPTLQESGEARVYKPQQHHYIHWKILQVGHKLVPSMLSQSVPIIAMHIIGKKRNQNYNVF